MLRRISFITAFAVLFISLVAVPINASAYAGPAELCTFSASYYHSVRLSFNLSYDGIVVIHRVYKSFYSPDTINSPVKLDNSYFYSGIWNSQDVSGLDSKYLYNLDVSGFSQTVSYTDEGNYFVYSLTTCLPVKAGDNFSIVPSFNSTNVREYSNTTVASYIPGGSGLKMVHLESGTSHPENPLTYTISSKNQHIVFVFNPDTLSSHQSHIFNRSNTFNCVSYPNLLSVGTFASCADIFTTSYDYTGDISVTLKDSIDNYSFSVYEIFTDGTTTPGYSNEAEQPASPDSSGSDSGNSDNSETSRGILDTVRNMFSKLKEIADNIYNLPQNIANKIGDLVNSFKDFISNKIDDFKSSVRDGLEYLFKPSDNNFEEIKDVVEDKFKFVYQIIDFSNDLISANYLDEPPDTNITIYGQTVSFMNWELYDKYKVVIDTIIIVCSYYFYIRRLIKRLPGIIGGFHT